MRRCVDGSGAGSEIERMSGAMKCCPWQSETVYELMGGSGRLWATI